MAAYLEKLLASKSKDSTNVWNSILERGGSVLAPITSPKRCSIAAWTGITGRKLCEPCPQQEGVSTVRSTTCEPDLGRERMGLGGWIAELGRSVE